MRYRRSKNSVCVHILQHTSYKITHCEVPPAEPDHGLNSSDHNCGHLVQWKCDVLTAVRTIDRRSTAVYTYCRCVQLCTDLYTAVHSRIQRSYILFLKLSHTVIADRPWTIQQGARSASCMLVHWQHVRTTAAVDSWLGSGSSSASFARYLKTDSLV